MTGRTPIPAIAGVLVGGRGARMGGQPKGLLAAPGGGTLLDRWRSVLREADPAMEVVLVGRREEYAAVGLTTLDDDPPGIGPLGGLLALLKHAQRAGRKYALLVACDMPSVSSALVQRILTAPDAAVVAPHRDDHWEPLCARYEAARVLPVALRRVAAGKHALQPLLVEAAATALRLTPDEAVQMHDWDAPADLERTD